MFSGIQALRLLAASSVALYHALHYSIEMKVIDRSVYPWSPIIFSSGVTVFFVISGFLMAGMIDRTPPVRFIVHRILRIYPAFLAAVGLVCIIKIGIFGTIPPYDFARVLTLFPSGPVLFPLGVEWTLVYEVFFYFLSAVLCFLPSSVMRKVAVAIWTVSIVFANEGFPTSPTQMSPVAHQIAFSYFNIAFIAGMLVWWLRQKAQLLPQLMIFGVGLCIIMFAFTFPDSQALTRHMISIVGATLMVKAAASPRSTEFFNRRLTTFAALGDGSYGLYLLHVPVITLTFALSGYKGVGIIAVAYAAAFVIGNLYGLAEFRLYRDFLRRINVDINVSILPAKTARVVTTSPQEQPLEVEPATPSLLPQAR